MTIENSVSNDFYICSSIVLGFSIATYPVCFYSFQTIEEFVSKDINYLITSQPRPKIRRDPDDLSPTPSPFNCDPSPSPGSVDDRNLSTVRIL